MPLRNLSRDVTVTDRNLFNYPAKCRLSNKAILNDFPGGVKCNCGFSKPGVVKDLIPTGFVESYKPI